MNMFILVLFNALIVIGNLTNVGTYMSLLAQSIIEMFGSISQWLIYDLENNM